MIGESVIFLAARRVLAFVCAECSLHAGRGELEPDRCLSTSGALASLTDGKAVRVFAYVQWLILRPGKTRKEPEMAGKLEDLGIPMRPARPVAQTLVPPRVTDLSRPATEPAKDSAPASSTPRADQAERRTMIVGRDISLSADIKSCNRLVVEGSVEATLHECRDMEIAEGGSFKGNASIEQAEVRGRFEGELVVSKRLLIRTTGHVSGTITYGEIEIERGGKVSGTIQENGPIPNIGIVRAGE
jgi:cytoskeletal protein CcmA (bactofilin family)